jgi:succinate dehydrogenase / fumarate reductase iron-sulfur subunit
VEGEIHHAIFLWKYTFFINKHGLWRFHTIFNCKDACPKDLNPTASISELKKMVMYAKY